MCEWAKIKTVNLLLNLKRKRRVPGELALSDGIEKDPIDKRDYLVESIAEDITYPRSKEIILNPQRFVKDQGSWNSCGSHAMATSIEIAHQIKGTNLQADLSERHHYRNARILGGTFPQNRGMTARNMLKVAQRIGIAPEKLCPYILSQMNDKPGAFADGFAHLWKIKHYFRATTNEHAKIALSQKNSVLLGVWMNKTFMDRTGHIKVIDGEQLYGGHEVVIYGYDEDTQVFKCINSWGKNYKGTGIMELPYNYVYKYLIDMWTHTI